MKKIFAAILISILLLAVSGCIKKSNPDDEHLPVVAVTSEMKMNSSDNLVENFLNNNKDFTIGYGYEEDACFNITPDFVEDHSSFTIFKYNGSTASFLVFDNESYILGECLGGYGLTSMALADLDDDNQYELYFTFSWGSGLHRSQIGYFNPAAKKVIIFDYFLPSKDMMLTTNENGDLLVNEAEIVFDRVSFVDFTIKSTKVIGDIISKYGSIALNITEDEYKVY
jgi:hypothetical protein